MSNLLIDIGNTFSKIAVFENNELIYEIKIKIIEINFIKDLNADEISPKDALDILYTLKKNFID